MASRRWDTIPSSRRPTSTTASPPVLVGAYLDGASPARRDSDHNGVDLDLRPGRTELPLEPDFEHALVALNSAVTLDQRRAGQFVGFLSEDSSALVASRCYLLPLAAT